MGVQIESKEAADNLEKTLGVDGIDMIGSGRGDLAKALGLTGQKNHPSVLALEEKIFDTARSRGKWISVNLDPTATDFAETVASWKKKPKSLPWDMISPFSERILRMRSARPVKAEDSARSRHSRAGGNPESM